MNVKFIEWFSNRATVTIIDGACFTTIYLILREELLTQLRESQKTSQRR